MKKTLSWLMAMAASVALAGNTTYNALSWKVGAKDLTDNGAVYANLYAAVGDARIGGAEKAVPANADLDLAAESVVQGEGGWEWGTALPEDATFFVELLNASRQRIVTSEGVPYADLLAAGALDVNGEGSFVPVNASGVQTFTGFAVADHGEFKFLRTTFGDAATVVPELDADGNVIGYTVRLKESMTGPVTLADNLGKVTLNLNRHAIAGTNGVNGAAGGNAIVIAGSITPADGTSATELTLVSENVPGYKGTVAGGNGGAGADGGSAVYVASASRGPVKVNGSATADVKGGNGGNGISAGQGGAAFAAAEGVDATSDIAGTGAAGKAYEMWAWSKCTFAGLLPDGVTQDGDTLRFWKREGDSDNAPAKFDFGEMAGQDWDGKVNFVDGNIYVKLFYVPETAGSVTFVGGTDTVLIESTGLERSFAVDSEAGSTRVCTWTNLTFNCAGVELTHGAFRVQDCTFAGCAANQFGGAIDAQLLDGDSEISGSRFEGNEALYSGDGGAILATASVEGKTLAIVDSYFKDNVAANGGAISTETRSGAADKPIDLVIAKSVFADNEALMGGGGAISAEGDVTVDGEAVAGATDSTAFTGNFGSLCGGAIAFKYAADEDDDGAALALGRGVRFVGNVVSNETVASGGAIDFATSNCTLVAEGVLFRGNRVYGGVSGANGGAFSASYADVTIDTCVFDDNDVIWIGDPANAINYGGALEIADSTVLIRNSSFRHSNVEAVTTMNGEVEVVNCVVVDNNGDGLTEPVDLYFEGEDATVKVSYTAYSNLWATAGLVEDHNLAGRSAAIYAGDDTLKLRAIGFNPVAALGDPDQEGALDFEGVAYGSLPAGVSMGAYETPTEPVLVNLDGSRIYDGTMESNGCAWTWTLWATNGEPLDVGVTFADLNPQDGLKSLFTIDSWTYGNDDAGYYASSNAAPAGIAAEFSGADDEINRWIGLGVITFAETGAIARRPVEMGGVTFEFAPDEYEYTGAPVNAAVVLKDTLADEALAAPADYTPTFTGNVNPTAAANANIEFNRNFVGETNRTYFITAYLVEYAYDGELDTALTETVGKLGGDDVAASAEKIAANLRAGYAFDKYDPASTGTVRRLDAEAGILRLQVRYLTDANGDSVPDVYQKKIAAMVVNGEWNDAAKAGVNQDVWVTLAKDGKWDVTGTGRFGGVESETLPAAGNAPDGNSQAKGGWMAFRDGRFVVVSDPAALDISASTLPVFLYGYLARSATSGYGRGGRGGSVSEMTLDDLAAQYGVETAIENFSVDGNAGVVTLGAKVKLVRQGAAVAEIPAEGLQIRVRQMSTLNGPGEEFEVQPDADGNVKIRKPEGAQAFFQIGL